MLIGIQKTTGQPELIITGLKQDLAHWIINEYNARIRNGEVFSLDAYYAGFLGDFQVIFKKVEKKHYTEYFGWAKWLYSGNDFTALQMIYPNTSGIWPWDEKAPEDFTFFVPKLYQE